MLSVAVPILVLVAEANVSVTRKVKDWAAVEFRTGAKISSSMLVRGMTEPILTLVAPSLSVPEAGRVRS